MTKYDVVIIGSGLGGLQCGYILARRGFNVCILEKNPQIGGCLQTFRRGSTVFDTGFHYVGGLGEGQSLHSLFRYFGLLDLPWRQMDEDCFAEVVLDGRSYALASGHERFTDTLAAEFPQGRQQIKAYADFLKQVGEGLPKSFSANDGQAMSPLFARSAYEFLRETVSDALLREVLSGASLTMELNPESLPLYVFAQINNSFIQSAWRLEGGGAQIADCLADSIRRMGGTIITKAEVTRMIEKDGRIAELHFGEEAVTGEHIISNLHPALTLSLIPESARIKSVYRKRITDLPNTYGMFTTHLILKPDSVPYLNRNVCLYKGCNPWDVCNSDGGKAALLSYQVPPKGERFTRNIDILMPVPASEMLRWEDTSFGHRGAEYANYKARKADECLQFASEYVHGLASHVEAIYTSTPLTYRHYTGTWAGSAFGVRKDYNRPLFTILAPQTPIQNLLLTGQNLNLHGMLGVSMTSFFTCARIVGMDSLVSDLFK